MESKKRLGEILVSEGLVTESDIESALKLQKNSGKRLGDILVGQGLVTYDEMLHAVKNQLNVPLVDPDEFHIRQETLGLMPERLARKYEAIPLRVDNGQLTVAMSDPSNYFAIEDIRMATGYIVKPAISARDKVLGSIEKHYGKEKAKNAAESFRRASITRNPLSKSSESTTPDAPVVRFIDTVLDNAVMNKASDIHIEPGEKELRVRYRIDGFLEEMLRTDMGILDPVVSRIKIMANLNISEKRVPQDGRFLYRSGSTSIDMRVSIVPGIYGEKMVIRLLGRDDSLLDLNSLGFTESEKESIGRMIRRPYGMILLCGPTGSGKTTTLYSFIKEVNDSRKNIVTIEDPVEYNLPGINQMQVNNRVGFTFATGLRSILRQDPDIVLVGEVRDSETAEISVRAALTGHLVFSTIHTNSAASTITRLRDMEIEEFLLSSTVAGVISQRLVRKVCPVCSRKTPATDSEKKLLSLKEDVLLSRAEGCPSCGMKGYKGREAVFEVMEAGEGIRNLIAGGASDMEIERMSISEGMRTLRESCIAKVIEGTTTIEELIRTTY